MNFIPGTLVRHGTTLMFQCPAFTAPLPAPLDALLSRRESQRVTLGIRPKDMQIQLPEKEAVGTAEVTLREPIGSDLYLQVQLSNELVCKVRTDADNPLQRGEVVTFAFHAPRLHFFDVATGNSLLN